MRNSIVPGTVVSISDFKAIANRRTRLGIIVLTCSLELLYLNKQARELGMQYTQAQNMGAAGGVVPLDIMGVCQDLIALTRHTGNAKDCEEVSIKRVIGNEHCALLVEGIAVPHPTDAHEGRVILILQPIRSRQEGNAQRAKERFNLTEREEAVVTCLSMGLSNKEIGLKLGVTEPTVKEHLRHVMQKMKTTSRTGVLAKVLFEDKEYVVSKSAPSMDQTISDDHLGQA